MPLEPIEGQPHLFRDVKTGRVATDEQLNVNYCCSTTILRSFHHLVCTPSRFRGFLGGLGCSRCFRSRLPTTNRKQSMTKLNEIYEKYWAARSEVLELTKSHLEYSNHMEVLLLDKEVKAQDLKDKKLFLKSIGESLPDLVRVDFAIFRSKETTPTGKLHETYCSYCFVRNEVLEAAKAYREISEKIKALVSENNTTMELWEKKIRYLGSLADQLPGLMHSDLSGVLSAEQLSVSTEESTFDQLESTQNPVDDPAVAS